MTSTLGRGNTGTQGHRRKRVGASRAFGSFQKSFSSLYPGIELLTFNVAQFNQVEWASNGWKLAGGVRTERNLNPGVFDESSGPVWRFGMNRALTPSTNLRLSYESLRFASLAERYVKDADRRHQHGNLGLQNESGNNWELGLVQELKGSSRSMLLEAAAFVLNYEEMIEYTLQAATDSNGTIIIEDGVPQFYFQPLNLGRTRIAGFELSATGEGQVGRIPVRAVTGHLQLRRRFDQRRPVNVGVPATCSCRTTPRRATAW